MRKCIVYIFILFLAGCSGGKVEDRWHPTYRVQGGLNTGGITENTDFSKTLDIPPDAFSGATKTGYNIGGHVLFPVLGNSIETGIDYMYNNQSFTYNDHINGFKGTREIKTSQLMLPIAFSFGLFKEEQSLGILQLKIGYVLQYNLYGVSDNTVYLTSYSMNHFSSGMTFGLSLTPFQLANGNRIGVYLDGYRGTKMYDDYYNRSVYKMPGSSYLKFGVLFQF